jgi:hypothetical protein
MMDHRNPRDAAAISYFSSLALFPAVLVLIAVANDILGKFEFKQSSIVVRIVALFPVAKKFLDQNLSQIIDPPAALVLSCIVEPRVECPQAADILGKPPQKHQRRRGGRNYPACLGGDHRNCQPGQ